MNLSFLSSFKNIQIFSFTLAMLLYGTYGSPTPDNFTLTEVIIALLLLIASRISQPISFPFIALGYGVLVPLFIGIISGYPLNNMMRDLIPFLFLFLPLVFGWLRKLQPTLVLFLTALIGFIFSIRTIISYKSVLFSPDLWGQGPPSDLLYLANSPEVLWAALISIGYGTVMIVKEKDILKGLGLISISFIPVLAMTLMTQRAGIGAVCAYSIILFAIIIYQYPKLGSIFLSGIFIMGFIFWPIIETIFQILLQKTELVGLNSRRQEWGIVLNILLQNWNSLLFGIGWGGHFENPAVGGISVNYTHSLISSLLLKTGVVGTVLILAGCLFPIIKSVFISTKTLVIGNYILLGAAIFPFIISVFLYASYKSLGFGLILLVFTYFSNRKLEKND